MEALGRAESRLRSAFATLKAIFVHEMYPWGRTKLVAQGDWLEVMGTCPIAGTTLVCPNNNHPFNNSCKLSSLETSYNIPVALWPHGLFNKPPNDDPRREYFDIVDRNRTYD
jgi:hypothetical protein